MDLDDKLQSNFALAREHLGVAAKKRKRLYDIRVKPRGVQSWGLGLVFISSKVRRPFAEVAEDVYGPFLITREIPPLNFVIHKSKRAKPEVVHVDKLKKCYGETPRPWLVDESMPKIGGLESGQLLTNDDHRREGDDSSTVEPCPSAIDQTVVKLHIEVPEIVAGPVREVKNSSSSGDDITVNTRPTCSHGEDLVSTKTDDQRNVADRHNVEETAFRPRRERHPPQRLADYVVRSGRS